MGGPVAAVLIERPLDDEAFGTLMRSLGANPVVGGEASFDVEIECGGIDCERYFPGVSILRSMGPLDSHQHSTPT